VSNSARGQDPIGALSRDDRATVRERNCIRSVWVVAEIGALGALLVLFNLYPYKIGILISAADPASFMPVLAPTFKAHMPWLNAWWGLALLLALAKLAYGHWTLAMRGADLGLRLLGAYVLGRLVFGDPLLGLNPQWASVPNSIVVRFADQALPLLNIVIKFVLGFAFVGLAIGAYDKLKELAVTAAKRTSTARLPHKEGKEP
jgi:hypothetical protein